MVEAQIAAARERGEFDNLPGAGKPLDLDDMAGLTSEQRYEAMLLKACGEVLEEVALLREIGDRRKALARSDDGPTRERLRAEMRSRAEQVSVLFEARRAAMTSTRRNDR